MKNKNYIYLITSIILLYIAGTPYGALPKYIAIISFYFVNSVLYDFLLTKDLKYIFKLLPITLNWIYFQSPFLLHEKTTYPFRKIPEEYITEMSIYPALAIILFFIFYDIGINFNFKPLFKPKIIDNQKQYENITNLFIIILYIASFLQFYFISFYNAIGNIIPFLHFTGGIVITLLIIYTIRYKEKNTFLIISGTVSFLIDLYIRINSTLFAAITFIILSIFIAYIYETKKIPLKKILIILIISIPIYNVRKYVRLTNEHNISKVDLYIKYIEQTKSKEGIRSLYFSDEKETSKENTNRFENLSYFGQIVYKHEIQGKDFWKGKTFYWLPIVIIPRAIFPDKPQNLLSTKIATEYGLRGKKSNASINFPQLMEGYINFGFIGLLIIGIFQGLFYSWVAQKIAFGQGDINLILAISVIKQFMHMEGNITLVFGACIQVLFFFYILKKLFKLET